MRWSTGVRDYLEAEAPTLRERKSLAEDAADARRDLILVEKLTRGEPIRERDTAVVNIGRAFSERDAEPRNPKQ
jgi:hypothetical protein